MTRRVGATLCTACHSLKKPGMELKHHGFALENATCTSCHDPHVGAQGKTGLLKPVAHLPFGQGKCVECHGQRKTGATTEGVPSLCFRCHEAQRAWLAAPVVHAPLQTRESCLACHAVHAGIASSVLNQPGEKLCFGCHDPKPFRLKNVHAALQQGCPTCHDPHGSKNKKLLTSDVESLCRTCHEDTSQHFHKISGIKDPRTDEPITCVSCHLPHSSDQVGLLAYDPKRELCIQCHDPSMAPGR
jgi:predicted CXXCH cytochrome family protein